MTREDIGLEDTEKFLGSDDPTLTKFSTDEKKITFNGLSKEEIMQYGSHPFWVKIRWLLFFLFWAVWISMLVAAILIVIFSPKCPYRPKLKWWQNEVIYQVDVANFIDSDNNKIGDLKGLIDKLPYFEKLGVKSLCLRENILSPDDPKQLNQNLSDIETFNKLKKELDSIDMHLIIDIQLNKYAVKDTEILEHWLTKYVDGVRIVGEKVTKENLEEYIKLADSIHSKTFKYKLIAAVPIEEIDQTEHKEKFLDLKSDFSETTEKDLKDANKFLTEIEHLGKRNGYILDQYNSSRISDRFDTKILNIYHSLLMLLRGSPLILYGDELGLKGKEVKMKWDDSLNCGFTSNSSELNDCKMNVKESFAFGSGNTLAKVYSKLIQLRNEPSFKWGALTIKNNNSTNKVISYVREAQGFDGYIVAANLNDQAQLVDFSRVHNVPSNSTVEYYYSVNPKSHNDFKAESVVDSSHLILHPYEFIVLKYIK